MLSSLLWNWLSKRTIPISRGVDAMKIMVEYVMKRYFDQWWASSRLKKIEFSLKAKQVKNKSVDRLPCSWKDVSIRLMYFHCNRNLFIPYGILLIRHVLRLAAWKTFFSFSPTTPSARPRQGTWLTSFKLLPRAVQRHFDW